MSFWEEYRDFIFDLLNNILLAMMFLGIFLFQSTYFNAVDKNSDIGRDHIHSHIALSGSYHLKKLGPLLCDKDIVAFKILETNDIVMVEVDPGTGNARCTMCKLRQLQPK